MTLHAASVEPGERSTCGLGFRVCVSAFINVYDMGFKVSYEYLSLNVTKGDGHRPAVEGAANNREPPHTAGEKCPQAESLEGPQATPNCRMQSPNL